MGKKSFRFVIIVASISLMGVIFTQFYWVKKALYFKERQFIEATKIIMKSVVNQLWDVHNDSTIMWIKNESDVSLREPSCISEIVDPVILKSLLEKEFKHFQIYDDYKYVVFNQIDKKFIMGIYENFEEELLASQHQISLDCLMDKGNYLLSVYFPNQKNIILIGMSGWLFLSILFIVAVIIAFYYTVSILMYQKKLSEMKTDFVNNMTHEFKTPISTISLASEMLLRSNISGSSEKTKKYAHIILDENNRLQNQVEQILQISILDKNDMKIKIKEINVHKILSNLCDNFKLSLKESKGKVSLELHAENPIIMADRAHFINMISNLLDNAKKYSRQIPKINLKTENYKEGIKIIVKDDGIGISHEQQKHIFKKLYRVPTGNIHDVKGFGLGLYYTKTMVEAHGGLIKIHSELGKGSRFELYLPFKPKNHGKKKN